MDRPCILITTGYRDGLNGGSPQTLLNQHYIDMIRAAGGLPVLAPPTVPFDPALAEACDAAGLLLSGGADLDAALYGQPPHPKASALHPLRQASELAWLAWAEGADLPILGICLGCQVINVHRGGSLLQHLPDVAGTIDHGSADGSARHDVAIGGGRLREVLGPSCRIASRHHQAVHRLGRDLAITARAPDGVVEAIEDDRRPFVVGVQWHPESLGDDAATRALARAFVQAARRRSA
ncbi:MAG: gamma-glutamyl-gamma-aminobutyrate hydrolase family protein [Planctomycetes bacterium]|nr:gamma-glutamyl-gamma-aminobutyrate hydrolase family protein [Planctomycetota bacterium]